MAIIPPASRASPVPRPHLTPSIASARAVRFLLLLLPFGYLIPDLAENLSIAWLIQDYPKRHDAVASALEYMTALKRICMSAALFLPLVLLSLSLISGRRRPT